MLIPWCGGWYGHPGLILYLKASLALNSISQINHLSWSPGALAEGLIFPQDALHCFFWAGCFTSLVNQRLLSCVHELFHWLRMPLRYSVLWFWFAYSLTNITQRLTIFIVLKQIRPLEKISLLQLLQVFCIVWQKFLASYVSLPLALFLSVFPHIRNFK